MSFLFGLSPAVLSSIILSGFFIGLYFLVGRKLNRQQRAYEMAYPMAITQRGARLMLLFTAILFPLGGILYENTEDPVISLSAIMIFPGLIAALLYGIVRWTELGRRHYLQFMNYGYHALLFVMVYLVHRSGLETFFQGSLVLLVIASSLFIRRLSMYVLFSTVFLAAYTYALHNIDHPETPPPLALFMVVIALLLSVLMILLRERHARDLAFSQAIIQYGNAILIATDQDANVIYISKSFEKYTGYKATELLGRGWWNIRQGQTDVQAFIEQIRNKTLPAEEVSWLRTKKDSYLWIKWNNMILPSGIVIGLGTDITEQQHYEKTFVDLVEHANDFVYLTDAKGNFTYANASTLLASGYSKEEFFSMHFTDIVAQSHKKQIADRYFDQFEKKIQTTYAEFPVYTKRGEMLWVGQVVKFNFSPVTGDFEGAQAICRNITEANRLKQELEDNLERLRIQDTAKQKLHDATHLEEACINMLKHLATKMEESKYMAIGLQAPPMHKGRLFLATREQTSIDSYTSWTAPKEVFPEILEQQDQIYLPNNDHPLYASVLQLLQLGKDMSDIQSLFLMGIRNGEGAIAGFFVVASDKTSAYPEYNQLLFKDLSEALSGVYINYEQIQTIRRNARFLEILNTAKKEIIQADTIREIHLRLLDVLYRDIEQMARVSISIFHERNTATLLFRERSAGGQLEEKIINTGSSSTLNMFRDHLVYYKPDLDQENLNEEDRYWYEKGVRSVLCMPLFVNSELYGAVNLLSNTPGNFTEQHLLLTDEIIDSASVVIGQYIYNDIIQEKNKSISDSIEYASRIQQAIIPPESLLRELHANSFVFFQQRDSLGGDFYLCGKAGQLDYFVVGDCTGHGVSGSLLSMLASNLIQQAIHTHELLRPSDIIHALNSELKRTLNQYSSDDAELTDGLDISIAVVDAEKKRLQFSAAMHTGYLLRAGELIEMKGSRLPIGAGYNASADSFDTREMAVLPGDEFYFSTDGFMDQFNGLTGKKFGRTRFRQLLLDLQGKPADTRKAILMQTHILWKGNSEQTDDICVLSLGF